MKNLLAAGLLSLAALGMASAPAPAWFHHCHHCCDASMTFCCRPYNAFTPSCFGNVMCNGCCPFAPSSAPYCYPPQPPYPPSWAPTSCDPCGQSCCSSEFGGNGQLPPAGTYKTTVTPQAIGNAGTPGFTPPTPTPADGAKPPLTPITSQLQPTPMSWGNVQPTGYSPTYPGYYPTYPGYQAPVTPGYAAWNAFR